MDIDRVRRLTEDMRRGSDPRWVSLRAFLTHEDIDLSRAVLADMFSDGADLDTGVLIDSAHLVYEFTIRYRPMDSFRKPTKPRDRPKRPVQAGPVADIDGILERLSERSRMDAEVVSWIELHDAEAMFPHSQQIEAGLALLTEEASGSG
jgi:hypothetical protein